MKLQKHFRRASFWSCCVATALSCATALAYEVRTHASLTARAIDQVEGSGHFGFARELRAVGVEDYAQLAYPLAYRSRTRQAREWIIQGSVEEDSLVGFFFDGQGFWPLELRVMHHFHNPLAPLPSAGLHPTEVPVASLPTLSSIDWMLAPESTQAGNFVLPPNADPDTYNMSWNDARTNLRRALTDADPDERRARFALVLKALGHVMHLIEDASVPSHVRNDAHLDVHGIPDVDLFHKWMAEDAQDAALGSWAATPRAPDPALLRRYHVDAVRGNLPPLANLIDANRYSAVLSDPNRTLTSDVGIAEFTQANFFSNDTIEEQARFINPSAPGSVDVPRIGSSPYFSLLRGALPTTYIPNVAREINQLLSWANLFVYPIGGCTRSCSSCFRRPCSSSSRCSTRRRAI